MQSYDVMIVGAGVVGLTLANLLGKQSTLSVAVLDVSAKSLEWDETQYHHRLSALSLASQRILKRLGAWDIISAKRISPFEKIQIWDHYDHSLQFQANEIAETVLGYIVENTLLEVSLQETLAQYPHVQSIAPIHLQQWRTTDEAAILHADQGLLSAKLIVAADGAHSWLRTQANIAVKQQTYDQVAFVTNIETTQPHQKTARQIFDKEGPLGLLPLTLPHQCSIVWSRSAQQAEDLKRLSKEEFKEALNVAARQVLGDVIAVGPVHTFALFKQQAQTYIGPRLGLIGDAAHTVHPLAGQGLNMGMLDAATFSEVLMTHLSKAGLEDMRFLRRYERWRRADNAPLMFGIDAMKTLFAGHPTLQSLLGVGLDLTTYLGFIKNIFTRHAVGNRFSLPVVARKLA